MCGIAGYSLSPSSRLDRTVTARALLAGMAVDSEIIFALAERSRGCTARVLQELVGSMATAWLDEARPELILARGMGRPLWIGTTKGALVFASTKLSLELVDRYAGVSL